MAYEYTKRKFSTIASPNGTKYTFGYNAFNQCITTKVGTRTLATNSYDTLGRLTGTVYGNGDKVENVYDIMSRITSVKYDGVERVKYTYDNDGNVSKIDDKFTNIVTTFRYDSIKRPISKKTSNGYSTEIRYDDKNRVESTAQTIGSRAYNTEYTYNNTGIISGVQSSHGEYKIVNSYDWDELNRVTYRCVEVYTEENGWEEIGWQNITYKPGKLAGSTTSLVSALDTNSNGFQYTYDDRGNITQIKNHGVVEATYTYDQYDRLISETANGVTTTWTYDSNGNILTRTTGGTTVKYTYGDSTWKDLLTNYNGQAITYDNIGNPTKWGNTTYTWDAGRRLMTLNKSGVNASFTYNIDGYRTKKTVNGVTTEYYLDGDRIVGLKKGTDELFFIYDEKGYSIGFYYNGEPYIYAKNLQGDVIGIVDKTYDMVVTYSYDAWGKLLSTDGDLASTLGKLNPFRYRSYVYDDETGLYYLNSRYYDAGVGRFLNADKVVAGVGQDVKGYNLYAYCFNNPVNMDDQHGCWPRWIDNIVKKVASVVTKVKAVLSIPTTIVKITTSATVAVASGQATIDDVCSDIKDYDFFNEDEKNCIKANVFSSYNGTPVVKQDISRGSMSACNTIFLSSSEKDVEIVKHEWGHTVQQSVMGTPRYVTRIFIPSVIGACLEVEDYYSQPWERSAEYFGGANNGPYNKDSEKTALFYFLMP